MKTTVRELDRDQLRELLRSDREPGDDEPRSPAADAWERALASAKARAGERPSGPAADRERWYKTLEVEPGADLETVRRAYREALLQYHPDGFVNDPEKHAAATEVTRRLTEAYEGLSRYHASMSSSSARGRGPGLAATAADLLAIPEHERFHEVVDGELVRKAMPSGPHGRTQSRVVSRIGGPYDRRPGGRLPGGWWIVTEVEIELEAHQVYRPDVAGWRRDRLPELPKQTPIAVRPDWVCEVLSESNASNDLVRKMRGYQHAGLPHYWVVDPGEETLTVYRWTAEGFLLALAGDRKERVRAEPFEAVELFVGALFGEDEELAAEDG